STELATPGESFDPPAQNSPARKFFSPLPCSSGKNRNASKRLGAFRGSAAAEGQATVKNLLKQSALLFGGRDFAIAVADTLHFDLHHPPITRTTQVADSSIMPSIKRVRDPQN